MARESVKIAESCQDFWTASGEANRGLELSKRFRILGKLGLGCPEKETSYAEALPRSMALDSSRTAPWYCPSK